MKTFFLSLLSVILTSAVVNCYQSNVLMFNALFNPLQSTLEVELLVKYDEVEKSNLVEISVDFLNIELFRKHVDLCNGNNLSCLYLKQGDIVGNTFTFELNEFVPHSPHTKISLNNNHDQPLFHQHQLSATNNQLSIDYLFYKYLQQFQVTTEDQQFRKHVFKANLEKIMMHNEGPNQSYKMSVNHFAHYTSQEFKYYFASGFKQDLSRLQIFQGKNLRAERWLKKDSDLPEEVNWVEKGGVTPVKNQGTCGSCWSFATTGALEGAYFVKFNKLVSFSEQELVACDHVDLGCNGGAMDNAYDFIKKQKGLCTEESFPYTAGEGVRGFCNVTCTPVLNSAPSSWIDVDHTEQSLMEAVSKQPVAVAIEADEAAFQFYSSGVLTAPCAQKLDHGVLVVGYGVEDGIEYWLIKNSWGPMWGDKGYIKIERGVELDDGGECGVLLGASYPVLS